MGILQLYYGIFESVCQYTFDIFLEVREMDRFVSIQLDRSLEKALYIQIYEGILEMIREKQLSPEEKLAPIRGLSSLLDVNSGTVVSAYKLLEERGYVVSRVGSGTYVSPDIIFSDVQDAVLVEEYFMDPLEGVAHPVQSPGEGLYSQAAFDFAGASISPEFFPVEEFKQVLNEVLDRDKGYAFGYQESTGYPPLREAIRDVILTHYGTKASIESIQIVSGAQQGIDIIAKTLLEFQDTVFVESPTYTGAINAFKSHGAKIVEVPMELDGVDISKFKMLLKSKPKLFYSMPNFHNPTGYCYSKQKRRELLALASEHDFYIVEDDHINDLFYDKRPTLLKSIDEEDRVFYIKSFSKPFMPGIRLAFMLPPEGFSEKVAYAKYATDIFSSGLSQRSMELFLRRGFWEKKVDEIRKTFKLRRDLTEAALKKYLPPGVKFHAPAGGLFFWLSLPEGFYSMNLYNEALKKGVLMVPGDLFFPDRRPSSSFRLSIAEIDPHRIEEGVELLSGLIRSLMESYPTPNAGPRPIL